MNKLTVFNHVSVDGFFAGPNDDIDWFQSVHDDEWNRYTRQASVGDRGALMFGRTTYEMMRSFCPTPAAHQLDPIIAKVMNESPKIVFSKSLGQEADGPVWKNVQILNEVSADKVKDLKKKYNITVLGSGTIVQQLTDLNLVDEYTLTVVPIILGAGKPLFKNVRPKELKLLAANGLKNGATILRYQPNNSIDGG